MLTIGELAVFAGVTVRTVRHYHQIGLLPEPDRDASGYRRYGSGDVIRLVRIRGLAAAGVPLSRVGELLDAGPQRFAEALDEVDALLRVQIAELRAHRRRLAAMTEPDAGVLTPAARELLALMEGWGLPPEHLAIERDCMVLMSALYPDRAEEWVAWQLRTLEDPEVRALYLLSAEATGWEPDDPRIEEYARRSVALTVRHYPPDHPGVLDWWDEMDQIGYRLVSEHGMREHASWRRISTRVEELMREAGYVVPDGPR